MLSNHQTVVGSVAQPHSAVYCVPTSSSTGDDSFVSDDHLAIISGFQHPAAVSIPAVTPSSTTDPIHGEVDRASVGSETDSGVICTSGGGTSASISSASPCNGGGSTVAASRPSSYVGNESNGVGLVVVDGGACGIGTPSVGNLSSVSSQDSASTQSIGFAVSGNGGRGLVEINCPLCRRAVAAAEESSPAALLAVLPRNRSLEAIVDRYRETRRLPIQCQRCQDDQTTVSGGRPAAAAAAAEVATLVCEQCVAFYCDRCYEKHHGGVDVVGGGEKPSSVGDQHTAMQPVAKGKTWLAAVSRGRTLSCTDHTDETLSMFCVTCRTAVCCLCICGDSGGEHCKHQTRPLGTMAKTHKASHYTPRRIQ
jgi:tripartite motif-containing protein 9/67